MAKTGLVWVVDFAAFAAAWGLGAGLSEANLLGFAAGAALNAWLKMAQLPPATSRSAPILSRLLFVSLLSLFLRSGVLVTCSRAFGWPWPAALLPAIVTGWTVLFLGYALFIWPVREQYGSGVRWRVAAMGATAYLLALRLAYLCAMPVDRRLADLELASRGIHTRSLGAKAAMLPPGWGKLAIWGNITVALRNLGTTALGQTRAGQNLPALLCWVVAAWAVFHGAQRAFDKTTAFRALLLFSVLPAFFWIGSVFSPATVLVTGWAAVLWLMTFALGWERKMGALACAAAAALFWWPGWWLPGLRDHRELPPVASGLLFVGWQAVLVTPVALMAVGRYFARHERGDDRRLVGKAAAICAAVAGVSVLAGWLEGRMGIAASGAMWLPLLPLIAAEMQRPGSPPERWWGPAIYGCVACYGVWFYWLAFPGWG
jgi:hypothetical protein